MPKMIVETHSDIDLVGSQKTEVGKNEEFKKS